MLVETSSVAKDSRSMPCLIAVATNPSEPHL
jgi:hypothetical protein